MTSNPVTTLTTPLTAPTVPDVRLGDEAAFVHHVGRLHGGISPSGRELWLVLLDRDGHWLPVLPIVGEMPERPDPTGIRSLFHVVDEVLEGHAVDGHVAVVLDRPGLGDPTPADRAWADGLRYGARSASSHFLGTYVFTTRGPRRLDDEPPQWPGGG